MSNLLHYMLLLSTNKTALKAYFAATDPAKSAEQRSSLSARIRKRYGLTATDWKVISADYPSRAAANTAITKHLQKKYKNLKVVVMNAMNGCGVASLKV